MLNQLVGRSPRRDSAIGEKLIEPDLQR